MVSACGSFGKLQMRQFHRVLLHPAAIPMVSLHVEANAAPPASSTITFDTSVTRCVLVFFFHIGIAVD